MTHLNEILKMEDKDKKRIFHEIVQNGFAFAKSVARTLSGGKENISLEKEIIEEIMKNSKSLFEELPEK